MIYATKSYIYLKFFLFLCRFGGEESLRLSMWKIKTKSSVFDPISNIEYPFCILFKDHTENKKYMTLK